MVWNVSYDDSTTFHLPNVDRTKLRLSGIEMDSEDFWKHELMPLDNLDGSRTSGSEYHPKEQLTELVVPSASHSIPNTDHSLHLGHEELPRTVQLDDLFTNHGYPESNWAQSREFSDLWDDLPLDSYTQQMVLTASPQTGGCGEGSSHAHTSRHEPATSTRTCIGGQRLREECRDPILRDESRPAEELDRHRQPEDLMKAAVRRTIENRGREFELPSISKPSSQNSTPALNSSSILRTPNSASVTPPTTLMKTAKASTKVRTRSVESACSVVPASSPGNGTPTVATAIIVLPKCKMPNANTLDGLQPRKVLKRGEVNSPEIKMDEEKRLPSKHRKGSMMDHVERERRRRDIMAGKLTILEELLPKSTKRDRISILYDAGQHITRLQQEVQVLKEKHQILAAAKCKTELCKGPVKMMRSVNVESSSGDDPSLETDNTLLKSMDTCRIPTGPLPRLGVTRMCEQPTVTIPQEKIVDGDSNDDRKTICVEFHMQLQNTFGQALEVISCQCKSNYLSSTMRTLQDMKLDVCRCSVMKMPNLVICVLFLKKRSNTSNYAGTQMSTQFAARLQYNQLKF